MYISLCCHARNISSAVTYQKMDICGIDSLYRTQIVSPLSLYKSCTISAQEGGTACHSHCLNDITFIFDHTCAYSYHKGRNDVYPHIQPLQELIS